MQMMTTMKLKMTTVRVPLVTTEGQGEVLVWQLEFLANAGITQGSPVATSTSDGPTRDET